VYKYELPLVRGRFIRRYKRFLVDVELDDGRLVTAHTTNTGSLKSCLVPGAPVLLSDHGDAPRKTRYTWESIRIGDTWVGVNTTVPNRLTGIALRQGLLEPFRSFDRIRAEVKHVRSRLDFYLENDRERMFLEVKNVTYREGRYALFPDAPTARGLKHLEELTGLLARGYRAGMLYIVGRTDVEVFAPAAHIDAAYARALKEAVAQGVEIYLYQVRYDEHGARFTGLLPVDWTL